MTPAFVMLVALVLLSSAADAWDYSETNWTQEYPECGGSSQSPINIDSDALTAADYSSFMLTIGYRVLQEGALQNDGHTLKFSVDESMGAAISGGPLDAQYTLSQFHLHWGSQTGQGSEHQIDGHSYDAELHLVHYKSTYDNISAAVADNQADSLAVMAVLIKEDTVWNQMNKGRDSESVDKLRKAASTLARPYRGPSSPTADVELVLDQFIASVSDLTGIYHYEGSLTTPSCQQIVQWIILDKPLYVQKNGLIEALRKNVDSSGEPLQDNYRPTQPLHSRTVYHYSAQDGTPACSTDPDLHAGSTLMVASYGQQQITPDGTNIMADMVDFLSLNGDPLPACLNETQPSFEAVWANSYPYMMKKQDGLPLVCTAGNTDAGDVADYGPGCYAFSPNVSASLAGSWEEVGNATGEIILDYGASDYNSHTGIILVGGMVCEGPPNRYCIEDFTPGWQGGAPFGYNNKTMHSADEGETFQELAPFLDVGIGQCAVFIDDDTLMVTGGGRPDEDTTNDGTWLLDVVADSWSPGPPMGQARSFHTCNLVKDCQGNKQVIVVGGWAWEPTLNGTMYDTEIYDVNSQVWSSGTPFPESVDSHGSAAYLDSFIVFGGQTNNTQHPQEWRGLGTYSDSIHKYDVESGGWTKLPVTLPRMCSGIEEQIARSMPVDRIPSYEAHTCLAVGMVFEDFCS